RAIEEDRMGQPSNRTIVGVGILLFTGVLMGVGIHHLVSTGTCSSTGYAANYGPVPYCPSGTGWWIGFLMIGIFGGIAGGIVAGGSSAALINGSIFTAIGVGSLTVAFDKHASSKVFAGVFGGCFAVVGGIILMFVLASALRSAQPSSRKSSGARRTGSTPIGGQMTSAFGAPQSAGSSAASAFGTSGKDVDPILGAYAAGHSGGADTGLAGTGLSSSSVADSGLGTLSGGGAAVAPPASWGGEAGSAVDSLSQLADLHQAGALTDAEFAREKAKILGS
ncbi:MAG TPA: SHOCT domain-containing protein, partial [Solirubrobacteraceae bacterium]|nr:SHOCT domain-containing protein [Solirubrobacteraceae bacterium]